VTYLEAILRFPIGSYVTYVRERPVKRKIVFAVDVSAYGDDGAYFVTETTKTAAIRYFTTSELREWAD